KVAFHVACHNRVQNFGYRGRDLLKWAGGDVTLVDRCCGMDGTWGMKSEFFADSLKVAESAARRVESAEPEVVSSDCPLAGLQLKQKTGRPSYHPVRILSAAYAGEPLRSPRTDNPEQAARARRAVGHPDDRADRKRRGSEGAAGPALRAARPRLAGGRRLPPEGGTGAESRGAGARFVRAVRAFQGA